MEKKKSLLKLILISFLLTACAFGGRSPDPHYYLMGYNLEPALQQDNPLVLGLGPITIADYLTRPQIVTRSSGNQVSYNDLHRWASGLRENIMDVLVSDLSHQLGSHLVIPYPWPKNSRITYQVILDIQRLDGTLNEQATLHVRWHLINRQTKQLEFTEPVTLIQPLTGQGYNSLVDAERFLLEQLSIRIANKLSDLSS